MGKGYSNFQASPAVLTVDVEAFCSWSMWTIRMTSRALANKGSTSYLSDGTCIKDSHLLSLFARLCNLVQNYSCVIAMCIVGP